MGGGIRAQVLNRLPGLAAHFHLSPVEVWELDEAEWITMALALDILVQEIRNQKVATNGR